MREILARPSLGKEHPRRPHDKKSTPAKQHGIWRENIQAQGRWQSCVLFSYENKGTSAGLQKHKRAYFCGWFRSFSAHAEQEGFKLRWNGYFAEIQNPYNGSDRKWEKCRQTRRHKCMFNISICSSHCNYSKKRQQFYRLASFAQNTDVHMSVKTAQLHDWPKWEDNYLYNGQLCTSCRTRIVIIFQQQLGFYIETKGSVQILGWIRNIIRSNDDSKCQACMREIDADKSWQAGLGKLSFSTQRRRDERGGSKRHSRLVTTLHR